MKGTGELETMGIGWTEPVPTLSHRDAVHGQLRLGLPCLSVEVFMERLHPASHIGGCVGVGRGMIKAIFVILRFWA